MNDTEYMRLALELAQKGLGWVNPNPMVGALIVRDDEILAGGYHHKCGDLHAERDALKNCPVPTDGATMYVTLEPCCHQGRQPPCTDAIIQSGIRRVVIGSGDPNPMVAGKGIQILRDHGITVTEHILEDECRALNRVFFHYIQTKRPYIALKYAMTMDGKIAAYTGLSKWITGECARQHVHKLRHKYSGIMVGSGTVLADNPMLNCRIDGGRNPVRIICDSSLRTPLESNLVRTAHEIRTILATCSSDEQQLKPYWESGCEVITIPSKNGRLDLNLLMDELGQREIDSILLEGGGTLNWSALEAGIVNKIYAYIAPKIFGGAGAKSPIMGLGFPSPTECIQLKNTKLVSLGEDYLIEGEVE